MKKIDRLTIYRLKELAPRLATLVALAAVIVVVFSTFFNRSLGWFAQNTEVGAEGLNVTTDTDRRGSLSIEGVKYDMDQLAFVITDDEHLQMNEHDTIFVERNIYTPLVLRVKLSGGVYEAGQSFNLDMFRILTLDGETLPSSGSALPNYISSVVNIQYCDESAFNDMYMKASYTGAENPSGIYDSVRTYFTTGAGADDPEYKFTTITNDSFTKVNSLRFNFNHTGNPNMYLYFYLTYDNALMTYYLREHVASVGASASNVFRLENDVELMTLNN